MTVTVRGFVGLDDGFPAFLLLLFTFAFVVTGDGTAEVGTCTDFGGPTTFGTAADPSSALEEPELPTLTRFTLAGFVVLIVLIFSKGLVRKIEDKDKDTQPALANGKIKRELS